MGTLYKRGNVWWVKYYRDGKPYRESTHSKKKTEAENLLKLREGCVVQGTFHGLDVERTTLGELLSDIIMEYDLMQRKSKDRLMLSIDHLKGYFGSNIKASRITTDLVKRYILTRQSDEVAPATINRELSALKRAFALGTRHTPPKVAAIPYIPKLREDNIRKGFFDHEDYLKLRDALIGHLKPLLIAGYYTGMRRGELLTLKWDQVDFNTMKITLDPGTTKNFEGRVVFLYGELQEMLVEQYKIRNAKFPDIPYVFFNYRTGEALGKDFRIGWDNACRRAGLGKRIFHDLRRSAVRNMIRSGVPETVAMKISGHKTRSIFDRYNITSENDLRLACERLANFHQNSQSSSDVYGHNLGTLKLIRGGKR